MARSSPEQESTSMSQNTWSPFTSHQTTHSNPPPPYRTGSSSFCKPGGEPTTPWLKQPVASITPPPSLRWSNTAITTNATPSSKSPVELSPPILNKKTTRYKGLNIVWKHTDSTNNSPCSRGEWTSAATSLATATSCATRT